MGMSSHVVFLRDKDNEQYQKMLKVLRACKDADVNPPEDVDKYFGGYGIDNDEEYPLEVKGEQGIYEVRGDYWDGYEVKLSEIPEGVDTIRFFNSY